MGVDLKLMFPINVTETSLTDVDNIQTGCIFIQSELKFSRQYYKVWEEIENKSEELRYKIHVFQNNEGESYYEDEDC